MDETSLKIQSPGIVTFRQLPAEEWPRLEPIYAQQEDVLPSAERNAAVVAEIGGEIIGLTGINLIVHAGPRWVHPRWRRMGIATGMGKLTDQIIQENGAPGYFVFPSNGASRALAERLGLDPVAVSVYRREF